VSVTREEVDVARNEFIGKPTQETAAMFLSKLHEAYEGGEVECDELYAGLLSVESYLWKGGTMIQEASHAADD
jgi:hypothetical protein